MQGPGATSGKNNADCEGEHDQSSNFLRTKRFFVICQYLRLSFCLSQAWLGKMFVFWTNGRLRNQKRFHAPEISFRRREDVKYLRENGFLSFPYVCPEPVLVKRWLLYINGSKSPFSYLCPWNDMIPDRRAPEIDVEVLQAGGENTAHNSLSCQIEIWRKSDDWPRQARDRHDDGPRQARDGHKHRRSFSERLFELCFGQEEEAIFLRAHSVGASHIYHHLISHIIIIIICEIAIVCLHVLHSVCINDDVFLRAHSVGASRTHEHIDLDLRVRDAQIATLLQKRRFTHA